MAATDKEIIQSAYADQVEKLFALYFAALAAGNEAGALDRFKAGLAIARRARDTASAGLT